MPRAKVTKVSPKAEKDPEQRFRQALRTANLLKLVSNIARVEIVHVLAGGERHAGGLCELLGRSPSAVSYELGLLHRSGIVTSRREGQRNYYSLTERGGTLARVIKGILAEES
jgi:DNA-binding transcriptional ArsR family regulator